MQTALPSQRALAYRTAGRGHGGITRLVSPGDLGQVIKPFVFVDLFDLAPGRPEMGLHPHSGIATVTVVMQGAVRYHETNGHNGVLHKDCVEWMAAGGGVWHGGGVEGDETVRGVQLWLALPPEDENSPAQSRYLAPQEVPQVGPARVIIGSFEGVSSPLQPRASVNYLHVRLRDGEQWDYQPPAGHDVAWVAVSQGVLHGGASTLRREVGVFEDGSGALSFRADGETEFVLGSAPRHPHDLHMGSYSVHTSEEALQRGEAEIRRIGMQLRRDGLL
jgi:redox-sensitive bicupin YhaK (pirin superfamily)